MKYPKFYWANEFGPAKEIGQLWKYYGFTWGGFQIGYWKIRPLFCGVIHPIIDGVFCNKQYGHNGDHRCVDISKGLSKIWS